MITVAERLIRVFSQTRVSFVNFDNCTRKIQRDSQSSQKFNCLHDAYTFRWLSVHAACTCRPYCHVTLCCILFFSCADRIATSLSAALCSFRVQTVSPRHSLLHFVLFVCRPYRHVTHCCTLFSSSYASWALPVKKITYAQQGAFVGVSGDGFCLE